MARERNPSQRMGVSPREDLLHEVLERTSDGVFTLDRDWTFTFMNPAAAKLLGRAVDELLGRNMWDEFPGSLGSAFEQPFREASETQQDAEFEGYFAPHDHWYALRIYPSSDGMTVYFSDTSEVHRQLQELATRAREQDALAKLSRSCMTTTGAAVSEGPNLTVVLEEIARTVAETLGASRVEIMGQPSARVAATVVASVTLDAEGAGPPDPGAGEQSVRVPVPGGAPTVTDIVIHSSAGGRRAEAARDFIESVVVLTANCVRQFELAREVRRQALLDPLTALPNRRLLIAHLEDVLNDARDAGRRPAVLALSVDRSWMITGSYGHRAWDDLLVALARRIQQVSDPHAMLARLSGDMFVLVVDDAVGELEPTRLAQRLHAAMRDPLQSETGEHFVELNVGIVEAGPASRPEELLRDADAALRRAGDSVRTVVLDAAMRRDITRRADLNRELHRALERDELAVHYQPLIDLGRSMAIGAEALVRWHHPERGIVMPGEFIPAAEENGLIVQIGAWVLEQAVRACVGWQSELGRPMRVSVNVSARQLSDPSFATSVAAVVERAKLVPGALELEITESLLIDYADPVLGALTELRRRGIRVALDDFGTGYSALSHLTQLAVDSLKIDRSFIERLQPGEHAAIVEAIIRMAHAVDLSVIAEGVETREQRDTLQALGCDEVQGYLYSPPVPAHAILEQLV